MANKRESIDSLEEFFGSSKTTKDKRDDTIVENDTTKTSVLSALIKSQPVLHHRRTPSDSKPNANSQKLPLTTNVVDTTSKALPTSSKSYDSDFEDIPDDNTNVESKKQSTSLPPSRKNRHVNDQKFRKIYGNPQSNKRRRATFLPLINQKKRLGKKEKSEVLSFSEQRLLSAQNNKIHLLESTLAELNRQLDDERLENKTLRHIRYREEKALKNYQNQEYDTHRIAHHFVKEMDDIKEELFHERETKSNLIKEVEDRDQLLNEKTKKMKFYEKLVNEDSLDELDELRQQLQDKEKKLKKFGDKVMNQNKHIEDLETTYRQEIKDELIRKRDLKNELDEQTKKYDNLLKKFENKTRQVDTMHIYIQRGGRRPSNSSIQLRKSHSWQSLQDTSPRFREKILEYDRKRREIEKLKPKPKPKPLPSQIPPVKRERIKYVPNIPQKPKLKPLVNKDEDDSLQTEQMAPKKKSLITRLSITKTIDEKDTDTDDELITKIAFRKPSTPPSKSVERDNSFLPPIHIHKRPITPDTLPIIPKSRPLRTNENIDILNRARRVESPLMRRSSLNNWSSLFGKDRDHEEESRKENVPSTLIIKNKPEELFDKSLDSSTPSTPPPPPPPPPQESKHPSMIMFEPTTVANNGLHKKTPSHPKTTNITDIDHAMINLHNGKPAHRQLATTKTFADSFETLFDNKNSKTETHIDGRSPTFTTNVTSKVDESDPFDSFFDKASLKNDKLQRPKIVTNPARSIPNRTVVEDIEEFIL